MAKSKNIISLADVPPGKGIMQKSLWRTLLSIFRRQQTEAGMVDRVLHHIFITDPADMARAFNTGNHGHKYSRDSSYHYYNVWEKGDPKKLCWTDALKFNKR